MKINQERLTAQLLKMMTTDSPSFEEKQMCDYLESYFKERNAVIYRDNVGQQFGGNSGNLLVFLKGTLPGEPTCFCCHMDTVEPGRGIKPVIKGDCIYSDGTTILGGDDKGGIAAMLEAYEALREGNVPFKDTYFLFSVCEEQGMFGVKAFDCTKLPCKSIVAIDGGNAPGLIAVSAPAKNGIKVTFHGKKAHAGMEPEKGISAIVMAAKAIADMKLGRIDPDTTSNLGHIEGGDATNIVADTVTLTGEVRSQNMGSLEKYTEIIVNACNKAASDMGGSCDVAVEQSYPVLKLSIDAPIYKAIIKAYEAEGITPRPETIGGGSDGNILGAKGYDCAVISCGMYAVHTTAEYMSIPEVVATAKVVYRLMAE